MGKWQRIRNEIRKKNSCTRIVYIKYQIFPMIRRKEKPRPNLILQRVHRGKKIYTYNLCVNTVSIQRGTNQPRLMLIFPFASKKWPRFLVFNNRTRVALFIKAAPKRLLSWRASRRVSAGHPAGKPIISPSVCAGVSPTSPRGCDLESRVNALSTKIFSLESCAVFYRKSPRAFDYRSFQGCDRGTCLLPAKRSGTCSRTASHGVRLGFIRVVLMLFRGQIFKSKFNSNFLILSCYLDRLATIFIYV